MVPVWCDSLKSHGVLALLPRPADRQGSRPLSRRHALRSPRPCCLPRRLPAAQGAVRGVGDGAAGAAALSRRPHRRPRRRPWAARAGHADPRRLLACRARRGQGAACLERARARRARPDAWPRLVGRITFVAGRTGRCGHSVDGRRGVEPCLRPADRSRARSGRRRWRARGGAAVLPRSCDLRCRRALRLGRRPGRDRHHAGRAPRAAGLSHLDAEHSRAVTPKNRLLLGAPAARPDGPPISRISRTDTDPADHRPRKPFGTAHRQSHHDEHPCFRPSACGARAAPKPAVRGCGDSVPGARNRRKHGHLHAHRPGAAAKAAGHCSR